MTEIKIYTKHERYSDIDCYTPKVSVDNYLNLEDFESEFLNELCQFVNDYWERKSNE